MAFVGLSPTARCTRALNEEPGPETCLPLPMRAHAEKVDYYEHSTHATLPLPSPKPDRKLRVPSS